MRKMYCIHLSILDTYVTFELISSVDCSAKSMCPKATAPASVPLFTILAEFITDEAEMLAFYTIVEFIVIT